MQSEITDGARHTLVAVVVTYNRLEHLQKTLARLLESPAQDLQAVVVVDNASSDGTSSWLASVSDSRLLVITKQINTGGAGGFESGMREAVARCDPDWIVVMDDDGRPAQGALGAFQAADHNDCEAIAAAVYFPSGEICEMNRPSRNPFWHPKLFLRTLFGGGRVAFHIQPKAYVEGPIPVDIASFVGLFISRAAIERVGYPDGGLFVYGDDGLYTLGLSRAGGQIMFMPSIRFEHDCSTFLGQRGRFRPVWKSYYYHRNLLLLYRQAAGWLFYPALLIVLPKWLSKVRHHSGERRAYLRLLAKAVRDGLLRETGTDHAKLVKTYPPQR